MEGPYLVIRTLESQQHLGDSFMDLFVRGHVGSAEPKFLCLSYANLAPQALPRQGSGDRQ